MDDREREEQEERERIEQEEAERERELEARREAEEELERECQRRLEAQEENMHHIKDIQEEIGHLNKSLNSCISIAVESIANAGFKKNCQYMTANNKQAYLKSSMAVDNAIDKTKENIERLSEEKVQVTERKQVIENQIVEHREQVEQRIERLSET